MTKSMFDFYEQPAEESKPENPNIDNKPDVDILATEKKDDQEVANIEETPEKISKEVPSEKDKEDTKELEKDQIEDKESDQKISKELENIKKALNDAKSWGHKKNKALINVKKRFTDFLNKLEDEGNIFDEQKQEAMSFFDSLDEEIDDVQDKSPKSASNPYVSVKENIDKEFGTFKKYTNIPNADEKYQAFFAFLPLNTLKEQEKIFNYMQEEEPKVVIDYILSKGEVLHNSLYKGVRDHGGIVEYFQHIQQRVTKDTEKIETLKEEIKKLKSELADTTEKVYNGSINSRVVNHGSAGVKVNSMFDFYK